MHENYRYAFLLAFFALEDILRDYLRHLKTRRGVSATKLKAYEKDIGMSYMINVELPMVTHPGERIQELLPDLKRITTIPNGIVHKAREVTHDDAALAIRAVSTLFSSTSS